MKRLKAMLKKIMDLLKMSYYTKFFYKNLLKTWILIDSKNGKDLGSNLLRIAEELNHNPEYKGYKIFISCNKDMKEEIKTKIELYKLNRVTLVKESGFRYTKVIALAKYIFTDTTLPAWYAKKEGQVITNTWHGTPLKMMGKDVGNRAYDMGNVQKNHLIADYLLYPSDYMKDIMVSAYFLDNLYKGKILCSGYPRNSIFFEKEKSEKLCEKLNLKGKKLYGYMPTWRGNLKNIDANKIRYQLEYYFMFLDEQLKDDELFLVRLHPFIANTIDYSGYKHIKAFPEGYDAYDILNICDCMITDYSSILFDYANSGKKIVLFVYDKEFYMDERGTYISMDTFPFPQVRRVEELVEALRTPKNYDDSEFRKKFCQYDGKDVAQKVCRHVIKGEKVYDELSTAQNGKENVLIYVGSLAKNGLTTAAMNLLSNLDREKRNYFVTFRSASLVKEPERIGLIPAGIGFLPIASMQAKALDELLKIKKYFEKNDLNPKVLEKVDQFYKRLYHRTFGECKFDYVIHYAGYEKDIINMFLHAPTKRAIFVHNDMVQEIETKGNQHGPTLKRAYAEYDKVIPVTTDIYESTLQLGKNKENIQVVNNIHNYKEVIEKSKNNIHFEVETLCNISVSKLEEILDSNAKKFITIGRFSAEKGHDLLLKAFDQYYKENPDSYLIIIGGYGALYDQTVALASSIEAAKRVIIIRSVANPMPILKKCDLFILSSLYEGLGLVLLEADTLGIPVISTDIVGPRGFMTEHGGYLVPPTVKGIYDGMKAFDEGKVKVMNVDYEKFNQQSIQQFESLFKGEV